MPSLLALHHTVFGQNYFWVVEHASCDLKAQAAVLRPVDSILPFVPFEAHRNTECITLGGEKQAQTARRLTGPRLISGNDPRRDVLLRCAEAPLSFFFQIGSAPVRATAQTAREEKFRLNLIIDYYPDCAILVLRLWLRGS
jgi:hypothetical protein